VKEVFTMWRSTRMIVLVALTAAVYAAVLIPFKAIPIIPGITEVRPANVFPVIFSLMFGPAAAWGSAIGNLIGDWVGGTFGPGSAFGFVGNFFFGLVPYLVWGRLGALSSGEEPTMRSGKQVMEYLVAALLASFACAVIIGWGLEVLTLLPFAVLGNIIAVNNFVIAAILGPVLLFALYPRVKRWGLIWTDVMPAEDIGTGGSGLATTLIVVGAIGGLVVGDLTSMGIVGAPAFAAGFARFGDATVSGQAVVIWGTAPFILALLAGGWLGVPRTDLKSEGSSRAA
jgi:energy-coupling factor transport system substrate-specific component